MAYTDPERIAVDVLQRSGAPRLTNQIAIDVEAILRRRYDVDVARVPNLLFGGQKLAGMYSPAHLVVVIEATDIFPRQRFTMAHELGHIEIHHKAPAMQSLFELKPEVASYRCTDKDLEGAAEDARRRLRETIANKFAAAVLMPPGLVREIWSKRKDVSRCAEDLVVSAQALAIRLNQLRIMKLNK